MNRWGLIASLVFAALIGVGGAWPVEDSMGALRALLYVGLVFGMLSLFWVVLPLKRISLPSQILVAIFGGALVGAIATRFDAAPFISDYVAIFGTLFLLLLKVVILPLIFVSVLCGVAGVGDARRLGSLGLKTLGYFLGTTAMAVLLAMLLVQVLDPGEGRSHLKDVAVQEAEAAASESVGQRIQKEVLPGIISNPIMPGQSPISVIFMAMLIGAALAALGERGGPALSVFRSLDGAFVTIIQWIMLLAPVGVFALMARVIAELGVGYIITLAQYTATVLLALGAHFCVVAFILVPVFSGVPARRFLRAMLPAFQLAFSTSSSAATLPVSIQCVTRGAGADPNIAGFVMPIGATINMDGTAIYVSIASIFIAQVYGIPLGVQQEVMIFLTAVLVSIGTAGIPGASIGLISVILLSAGIPVEGLAMVLGVDRVLDMARTVVNMTGDSAGALILSRSEGVLRSEEELEAEPLAAP